MKTDKQLKKLYEDAPGGVFNLGDIRVLAREMEKLEPGDIYFEIGVQGGRSLWIARQLAKPGVLVGGVDITPFDNSHIPDTFFINGDSREVWKTWDKGKIKLLFIDGDHEYEGVKADAENWVGLVDSPGTILFHDFRSDIPGVCHAVTEFARTNPRSYLWEWYSTFSWLKPENRYDDPFVAVVWIR